MKARFLILPVFLCVVLFGAVHAWGDQTSAQVRNAVMAELESIPQLGTYDVTLDVRQRKATLSGVVGSDWARSEIQKITERQPGVSSVKNMLVVRSVTEPVGPQTQVRARLRPQMTDEQLSQAVMKALKSESAITTSGLKVDTMNGVVTLRGSQNSFRDIDRILGITLMVDGVRDVQSEMTVGTRAYREAAPRNF